MNLQTTEKLKMLEWFDDFIQHRIEIVKRQPLPDREILKIYKDQLKWNKNHRLKLARMILRV